MHLSIWSRHLAGSAVDLAALGLDSGPHDLSVRLATWPEDAVDGCDALSIHLALAPETRGLVNAALLARLKQGAFVINTSRAEIVDQDALEVAARTRGLRAALDVFRGEPEGGAATFSDPIVGVPNVYGTPHIGASTDQAQEAIAAETVRIVRTFKDTGKVPNVVNLATRTPATCRLIVRHRDRPGVLAHVFDQLRAAAINVQETENVIFAGAEAGRRPHQPRRPAQRRRAGAHRLGPSRRSQRAARHHLRRRPGAGLNRDSSHSRAPSSGVRDVHATATARVFNFSSGPAVMPGACARARCSAIWSRCRASGMSILEVSHRSKTFEEVIAKAEADLRALANIPSNYKVLFLQGGASLQFSMVPLNLLTPGATADYIITGTWTDKAAKEAKKVGTVKIAATSEADNFSRIPEDAEIALTPGAAYVHVTSNNTIEGTQWHRLPKVGDAPLISDASSDILSRPVDVSKHGLIFAGAQKNLGPSGVRSIVREDLLARPAHTM